MNTFVCLILALIQVYGLAAWKQEQTNTNYLIFDQPDELATRKDAQLFCKRAHGHLLKIDASFDQAALSNLTVPFYVERVIGRDRIADDCFFLTSSPNQIDVYDQVDCNVTKRAFVCEKSQLETSLGNALDRLENIRHKKGGFQSEPLGAEKHAKVEEYRSMYPNTQADADLYPGMYDQPISEQVVINMPRKIVSGDYRFVVFDFTMGESFENARKVCAEYGGDILKYNAKRPEHMDAVTGLMYETYIADENGMCAMYNGFSLIYDCTVRRGFVCDVTDPKIEALENAFTPEIIQDGTREEVLGELTEKPIEETTREDAFEDVDQVILTQATDTEEESGDLTENWDHTKERTETPTGWQGEAPEAEDQTGKEYSDPVIIAPGIPDKTTSDKEKDVVKLNNNENSNCEDDSEEDYTLFEEAVSEDSRFLIFKKSHGATRVQAEKICQEHNAHLADIFGDEQRLFLAKKLRSPSYFRSWNGDRYNGTCLLYWPRDGAMTEPFTWSPDCSGKRGFVCEINDEEEDEEYFEEEEECHDDLTSGKHGSGSNSWGGSGSNSWGGSGSGSWGGSGGSGGSGRQPAQDLSTGEFGNRKFIFYNGKNLRSKQDAVAECKARSGKMVHVDSQDLLNQLSKAIQVNSYVDSSVGKDSSKCLVMLPKVSLIQSSEPENCKVARGFICEVLELPKDLNFVVKKQGKYRKGMFDFE